MEWSRILAKLPADVFASVDVDMEKPVLTANSIDGLETKYSCAGHNDGGHTYGLATYYSQAYLFMETSNEGIISSLQGLNRSEDNMLIEVVDEEDRGWI